ncbi:MAG: hypothetical protein DRJ29_05075 [Bacteroidetes bacterium]|nr:MAG: hypothetical protein DRJ29_05075 [Bacteroidota bacterium]
MTLLIYDGLGPAGDAVHLCIFRCDRLISCAQAKVSKPGLCSFHKVECPKGMLFEMGKPDGETYYFHCLINTKALLEF